MQKFYTGIGSRETPKNILDMMIDIGSIMNKKGYILRSGHAAGADRAFEIGANSPESQIYLPWNYFGYTKYKDDPGCPVIGEAIVDKEQWLSNHKYLCNLNIRNTQDADSVKLLHGRNVAQVIGMNLEGNSEYIICYCKIKYNRPQGGTASAYLLGNYLKIKVFNLYIEETKVKFEKWIQENK